MDETHKDELEREERTKSENSEKIQLSDVVRGHMIEKEFLEKRHGEEIEKLKEEFSKEKLQLLETHRREQSLDHSQQYGHVSHSSIGMIDQTTHAQSNGQRSMYSGGEVVNAVGTGSVYHNGTIPSGMPRNVYENQVSNSYGHTSGNYSHTSASGSLGQGSHSGLSSSIQADRPPNRQLPSLELHAPAFVNEGYSNGLVGHTGSNIHPGMAQPHQMSHFPNGGELMNGARDTRSIGHLHLVHNSFIHQQLNTPYHQQSPVRTPHSSTVNRDAHSHQTGIQVLSHNDGTTGLGYQARHMNSGAGVKEAQPTSPWIPEFHTYNSHLSKDTRDANSSNEKDTYGLSLELMNGPSIRVNSGSLASQIRPDLDFEDRLEQQQELLQEQFAEEKRQLRKSIQDEFTRKYEVERQKHEESMQSLKKTNLELEYQRKESEIKIRHEHEKLEVKYESYRTELERKLRKDTEDHRSKYSVKYETEMQQQRQRFEGIIEEQKKDIESLTAQLGELNESLKQEKDHIIEKFESEVKDIEQRLRVQKEKTESELVVKLKSEISLLTSVNKSLREEVDTKEKEKQELELSMKEERKRTEVNYENQISELEAHFEAEKQTLFAQYEEKLAVLSQTEKVSHEEASIRASEEILSLKKENDTLKKLSEKNYEMEQQICSERDEIVQGLIEEKELLRTQLEEVISKQRSTVDVSNNEELNALRMDTQKELNKMREVSLRLQNDLKSSAEEKQRLALNMEDLLKEIEVLRGRQHEAGVIREERDGLLKEVSKLNEEIDKMFEDVNAKGRKEAILKEKLAEFEGVLGQKERDLTSLKMEKMENQNKLNILERLNDDLKEDFSALRKRKVELEGENCNLKAENSDSKGKLSVLKTTNEGLMDEIQRVKKKIAQAEEEVCSLKLGNIELQQQVRMLRTHQSNFQETVRVVNGISDSEGSGSVMTSADETAEGTETELASRSKKKSALERQISKLKRSKATYEKTIEKLKQDIETLESEAMKQIEHNKAVSAEFVSKKKDFEKEMDERKYSKKTLEDSIVDTQREKKEIEGEVSLLEKQRKELECALEYLVEEEKRMKEANEKEMSQVSKTLEMRVEETQRQISLLESNKKDLQDSVATMEVSEASLRCSIEELQKESDILSQRISQMTQGAREVGKKRVSWVEDGETNTAASLGFKDVKEEITRLRSERDSLIKSVNELERKQTKLDISVAAAEKNRQLCEKEAGVLTNKKKELESAVFSLKSEKFELQTNVNELSATNVEQSTSTQRKEIEMLRRELEMTRENCENIRAMYQDVQVEGISRVDIVNAELRMAEDSLLSLKRERLELEKTISTLLRQKTELEAEVAMVVDAKYREDRDTTALREERLDLDAEVMRLKSQISGLRNVLSTLEEAKDITERELQSLDIRKERVESYVSGREASLLVGQGSPVSWNFSQSKDYVLAPREDLEKQVLELREQKLSLEADLFKLRRKSGDGKDMRRRTYGTERTTGEHRMSIGHLGASGDYGVQHTLKENESLHRELEGLTQERAKLSSELSEMKVRKTDLDAEITNLEYRKLGLEQSGRLVQRQEEGPDDVSLLSGSAKVTPTEEYSVKMDFLNYNVEQMQDLRKKNSSLEEKLGVLERLLHDAKYEMEIQTLEYQKELRLVQDAIKTQESNPDKEEQLNLIMDRLKTFITSSESSSTGKLYEEIKTEIRELNERVDANSQQMMVIQKRSSNSKTTESHSTGSNLKTRAVDEICGHIVDAEEGLQRYGNLVTHLQKQNMDLMEVVAKLEERLTAAGRSHEILQRKKTILHEMLEKVGEKNSQDLIQQTNLIFELDKDMPV